MLAAANPYKSKYDPKASVVENIKLPPTLLSRFDLIYLLLDKQNEGTDRMLANHIVSLYAPESDSDFKKNPMGGQLVNNPIDREFFAQYISYARTHCKPSIPDNVVIDLVTEY